MSIPKIIHQFWDWKEPPSIVVDAMDTMKLKYEERGYLYIRWNLERAFSVLGGTLENQFAFDYNPELCGKCDVIRYELLRKFGGIYVDADTQFVRHLDEKMLEDDFFAGFETEKQINNAVIGCIPDSDIINQLINNIKLKSTLWFTSNFNVVSWQSVGPNLLSDLLYGESKTYKDTEKYTIYPPTYFYPKYHNHGPDLTSENTYFSHFWGGTNGVY